MTLLEKIKMNMRLNEPFEICDLVDEEFSYDTVKSMLCEYAKNGEIVRYTQGIYYIPVKTIFGDSVISLDSVLQKKFIKNHDKIFGYYSGMSLLNHLGLTTQVPNIPEITSSKETNRKRMITIRNRNAILRASIVPITNDNVKYLQFIDVFRYANEECLKENQGIVIQYYKEMNLDYDILMGLLNLYPKKIRTRMKKTKLYDEFAYR